MDFDDTTTDMDEVIDLSVMKVVVDKKSVLYLYGTQLEYSDGLNGKGFHWVNPNASRTCGCGESFSL
jgi:iron-sulfur cluster assembly protein